VITKAERDWCKRHGMNDAAIDLMQHILWISRSEEEPPEILLSSPVVDFTQLITAAMTYRKFGAHADHRGFVVDVWSKRGMVSLTGTPNTPLRVFMLVNANDGESYASHLIRPDH
jgi:hypothetical protein